MKQTNNMRRTVALTMLLAIAPIVAAQDEEFQDFPSSRWEIWMGPMFWPAAGDLEPLASGRFDSTGLAIGFAYHVPVLQMKNSDLLVGVDASIGAADSNVQGFLSEMTARHLFIGMSGKWLFGPERNVSLDLGFGYHEADIAEVSTYYWGMEHEAWTSSRAGAFIGGTWDVSRGMAGRKNGLSLGFKVHFVDFGNVSDEDILFAPVLGANAGALDGPIYMLQFGYSGR